MGMTTAKGSETNDYRIEDFMDKENVSQEPVKHPETANGTAPKKRVVGRPFTPETSRAAQFSATRAKRMRKITRQKILEALCTKLDLGDEMVKAVKNGDEARVRCIEKAMSSVGLLHDQSCEALAQRFEVKSQNENKQSGTLEVVVRGLAETGN